MKLFKTGLILCTALIVGMTVLPTGVSIAYASEIPQTTIEVAINNDTFVNVDVPIVTNEEFQNGELSDGSLLPDEFQIAPEKNISRSSTGGYNYVYKRNYTAIVKRSAVIGDHPGIGKKKNVAYYYLASTKASASFSFGYGLVSVSFSNASNGVTAYSIKSISTGWTQLRIRGDVRTSNYTVSVYDRYSGKFIRSYQENNKKSVESIWYDTRLA
ncbi:hypothetical protein [Enterococcus sp. LJL90]